MKVYFTRDYMKAYSTGIYQNFGEAVKFRYVDFQIRGIGQISLTWMVK